MISVDVHMYVYYSVSPRADFKQGVLMNINEMDDEYHYFPCVDPYTKQFCTLF